MLRGHASCFYILAMKITKSIITVMKEAADLVLGIKLTDAEAEKHARKLLSNVDVGTEGNDAQEFWDAAKDYFTN